MATSLRYQRRCGPQSQSPLILHSPQPFLRNNGAAIATSEGALRWFGSSFAAPPPRRSAVRRRRRLRLVQSFSPSSTTFSRGTPVGAWATAVLVSASSMAVAAYSLGVLPPPSLPDEAETQSSPRTSLWPHFNSTTSVSATNRQWTRPDVTTNTTTTKSSRLMAPSRERQHPRKLVLEQDPLNAVVGAYGCASAESLYDQYHVDWNAPALGRGAFGSVHGAHDKQLRRGVALKRIDKLLTDPVTFQREITAFFRIHQQGGHNHIMAMRDIYEDEHYYYLVLDLAHGGEVYEDLIQRGPYAPELTARFIFQLASALHFLHSDIKMVHADLKPENLLLKYKSGNHNDLSLIDFGCAVAMDAQDVGRGEDCEHWRNPLHYSGTTAYWPPERFQPRTTPTPAMDMWSVGVILFIFLTNKHPFDPDGVLTDDEVHDRICSCQSPPRLASYLNGSMEPGEIDAVQDVIDGLLAVNPKERMTAGQLMEHPWIQQHLSSSQHARSNSSATATLVSLATATATM